MKESAQEDTPLKDRKAQSVLNMQSHNLIKSTVPENTKKDTHKTGKPFFPSLETSQFLWNRLIVTMARCQKRA